MLDWNAEYADIRKGTPDRCMLALLTRSDTGLSAVYCIRVRNPGHRAAGCVCVVRVHIGTDDSLGTSLRLATMEPLQANDCISDHR